MQHRFRTRILLTAMLCIAAVLSGCDSHSVEELLARAEKQRAAGDLRASIVELKSALELDPENALARATLGRVYLTLRVGAAAEKEFERALQYGMEPTEVLVELSRARLLQGKANQLAFAQDLRPESTPAVVRKLTPDERAAYDAIRATAALRLRKEAAAEKFVAQALAAQPSNAEARVAQARVLWRQGKHEESRRVIEAVINDAPEVSAGWAHYAYVERQEDNLKAAAEAYDRASQLEKYNPEYVVQQALTLAELRDYESTKTVLHKLKSNRYEDERTAFLEGLMHLADGDRAAARASLESSLRHRRDYLPAHYHLGVIHVLDGRSEQAIESFNKVHSDAPALQQVARTLAQLYLDVNEPKRAEAVLRRTGDAGGLSEDSETMLLNIMLAQGKRGEVTNALERRAKEGRLEPINYVQAGLAFLAQDDELAAKTAFSRAQEHSEDDYNVLAATIKAYLAAGDTDAALSTANRLLARYPNRAGPFNAVGLVYAARRDLDAAESSFLRAVTIDPTNREALFNLGKIAQAKEDYERARTRYNEVLALNATDVRVLLALSELEARAGNSERSLALLKTAVETNPEALRPRLVLAQYYQRTARATEALSVLESAPAALARNPQYLASLAQLQSANGQFEKALETHRSLIALNPLAPRGYYLLGRTYEGANQPLAAAVSYRRALTQDPNHIGSLMSLTHVLLDGERADLAEKWLVRLEKVVPNQPIVIGYRGAVDLANNFPEAALKKLNQAHEFRPTRFTAVRRARAMFAMGKPEEALSALDEWLEKNPTDERVQFEKSDIQSALGRTDDAVATLRTLLEWNGEHIVALNNLASKLQDSNPTEARALAEKAYKLAPTSPVVIDTYAWILVQQGELDTGIALLEDALKLEPRIDIAEYHYALALAKAGREKNARAVAQRMLDAKVQLPWQKLDELSRIAGTTR